MTARFTENDLAALRLETRQDGEVDPLPDGVAFHLRAPAPALSINELEGRGWQVWYRAKTPWLDTIHVYATNAMRTEPDAFNVVIGQPCTVHVIIPFVLCRRRDPHNYTSTVCKWIIDALVTAGMWPDDNPRWVEVLEPTLVDESVMCTVTITRRTAQSDAA